MYSIGLAAGGGDRKLYLRGQNALTESGLECPGWGKFFKFMQFI